MFSSKQGVWTPENIITCPEPRVTSFISLWIKVNEGAEFLTFAHFVNLCERNCQHKTPLRLFKNYDVEYKRQH